MNVYLIDIGLSLILDPTSTWTYNKRPNTYKWDKYTFFHFMLLLVDLHLVVLNDFYWSDRLQCSQLLSRTTWAIYHPVSCSSHSPWWLYSCILLLYSIAMFPSQWTHVWWHFIHNNLRTSYHDIHHYYLM